MLDAWFQSVDRKDRERQAHFGDVLSQLGRIQSMQWVDESTDISQCAVALVGELKVLIPLKGLVDVEAEMARLKKQFKRESADLAKSEAKLGNSRFVENAPAEVVEQEEERLAAHRATVEKLQAQIELLQKMGS
jgi:valyl-tRNA synthetase